MATTVFVNGRIYSPDPGNTFVSAMVVNGEKLEHIGFETDTAIIRAQTKGPTVNLGNRIVLPGFIDGHVHILKFGLSLQKLDLLPCKSLSDIRQAIAFYAATHQSEPRLLCRGWIQSVTDGKALATALDDLDPRPIYIEALDLHSTWCNKAALVELEVNSKSDPPGGKIHRCQDGTASGLLDEAAQFNIVWPFLEGVASLDKKMSAIDAAFTAQKRAGYTGVVDMAMSEGDWEVLNIYRKERGELPLHVAAHWLVPYSNDTTDIDNHIDRAAALHLDYNRTTSPGFCINGIKLLCDGTVDGCTAALHQQYSGLSTVVDPIWPAKPFGAAIHRATKAGLQCAIHAIGDRAVQQAIDCLSQVPNLAACRHRIEHLEITTPEDATRLGQLGIVASVQPVHSDPATFDGWPEMLGTQRCKRAFAYQEFVDGGATLAFGTDAPTADHVALSNLYTATTRRSVLTPSLKDTVNAEYAVSLATAVSAATTGAAYASFADEWTGSLRPGFNADFVVLHMQWAPETLLEARVCQTWYKGKKTFDTDTDGR
jgi:predicted amidohydrolase YtcJ